MTPPTRYQTQSQSAVMSTEADLTEEEAKGAVTKDRPVLVTGFGPFSYHSVNASWIAVQELHKIGVEHNSQPVPLEIREIPVSYDVVTSTVPTLYENLNPKLVVHVGVAPYSVIKVEKFGKNYGYRGADVYGCAPSTRACVPGGPELLPSKINIENLCECMSKRVSDVTCVVSTDAGRYLCDFIYYTSLHLDKAPVVFVHVPELNKPYTALQLAITLKHIIELLLEEIQTLS